MRKTQALRMKPGTLIIFEDWRKVMSFGERLGRVERVTSSGGVLATPVVERGGITAEPIGPAEWLPYSKVQLAYSVGKLAKVAGRKEFSPRFRKKGMCSIP